MKYHFNFLTFFCSFVLLVFKFLWSIFRRNCSSMLQLFTNKSIIIIKIKKINKKCCLFFLISNLVRGGLEHDGEIFFFLDRDQTDRRVILKALKVLCPTYFFEHLFHTIQNKKFLWTFLEKLEQKTYIFYQIRFNLTENRNFW